MSEPDITVITDQDDLIRFCGDLRKHNVVFVDTEFHRESTYWPTLCLIQASAHGVVPGRGVASSSSQFAAASVAKGSQG